jgi:hypothetical protein
MLAFFEHLDERHITGRNGDDWVLSARGELLADSR